MISREADNEETRQLDKQRCIKKKYQDVRVGVEAVFGIKGHDWAGIVV